MEFACLGRLGACLGVSGASWGVSGASGGVSEASWGVSWASWGVLGPLRGSILVSFGTHFGLILAAWSSHLVSPGEGCRNVSEIPRFLAPFYLHFGTKNH